MFARPIFKPLQNMAFVTMIALANYNAAAAQSSARQDEGLWADAKNPAAPEEIGAFGQFVGDWAMEWRATPLGGEEKSGRAEWHFRWALDGMAVQDVWIAPDREARAGGARPVGWGTGIRTFNEASGHYEVVWVDAGSGEIILFEGEALDGKILMRGKSGDGRDLLWGFDNITPGSFHWYEDSSFDGGKTFVRTFDMAGERIDVGEGDR